MAATGLGAEAPRVARAFQERVLACGVEPVNRLEAAVEAKLAEIRSMEEAPAADFAAAQDHLLEAVVASRPYRPELRTALDAALQGCPPEWPGFLALADTVGRWGIPHEYLHAAIDGVSMDVQPREYADFQELADYCYHVASVVGLCCIHIWGYRSEAGKAERLAAGCGIALQLTNILRDVREDARNGRIYLPRDEMNRFGVGPRDLDMSQTSRRVKELLAFEARRAYEFYDQARELVPLVAPIGRPVLLTITGIYRSLLDEIAARDFEVLSSRVTIPGWRKAAIALRALPGRFLGPTAVKTATSVM